MAKAELDEIINRVVDKNVDAQLEAELSELRSNLRAALEEADKYKKDSAAADEFMASTIASLLSAKDEIISLQKQHINVLTKGVAKYVDNLIDEIR